MDGKGILKDPEGYKLEGQFQDDNVNGQCIAKFRDEVVDAYYLDNIPYGFVQRNLSQVLVQEGQIQNGEFKIGRVLLPHVNRIYQGNFNEDSGFGTITAPNQIYEGGWYKYIPHGNGHFMDLNYNCKGQFLNGKFSGKIILTDLAKQTVQQWQSVAYQNSINQQQNPVQIEKLHEGVLGDHQFIGKTYDSRGWIMEGTWNRQIKKMTIKRRRGESRYESQWQNGHLNGIASSKHDNGTQITCTYVDGILHGKFRFINQQKIIKGEYKNGEICEDFELIENSSIQCSGVWRDVKNGCGKVSGTNYTYQGELKDGKYQGQGVLTIDENTLYINKVIDQPGEIIKIVCQGITLYQNQTLQKRSDDASNVINGKGRLINRTKYYIYEGELLNCVRHGYGVKLLFPNQDEIDNFITDKIKIDNLPFKCKQEGFWIDGVMSGQVNISTAMVNFQGKFLHGEPQGIGTLEDVLTNRKLEVYFENDSLLIGRVVDGSIIYQRFTDNTLKDQIMYYLFNVGRQ